MKLDRKQWIKKLDKLASEVVKKRDKACLRCFKETDLQCAHIISRSHFNTRWDMDNLLTLCRGCHYTFAHKEPLEFAEFVKEKLGDKKYQHLRMRGQMVGVKPDYSAIELYLNQKEKEPLF